VTPVTLLLLGLGYFAVAKLSLTLAVVHPNASPVWPPTGIALAAFLLLGYRVWPAIALGSFLVNLTTAGSVATSVGIATGNTLEGALGAFLVQRFSAGAASFHRPQDVLRFALFAGVVSTALSATFGVTSLSLGGFSEWERFGSVWLTWWLGNMAGALIVAPLLILWHENPRLRLRRGRVVEVALLALLLLAAATAVFGTLLPASAQRYAFDFMVLPPMIWAAFRFGPRGTATAALGMSCIALSGTLSGLGPFARATPNESLLLLQTFMTAIGLVGLLFAALVSVNRELAQAKVLGERLRFETLLSELLAGLIHVPAREIDASLEDGLRRVVAFLGVDRGNLEEYVRGGVGVHLARARPGVEPAPRVTDADRFPWTADRLRCGELVRFSRQDELPAEAATDRASYLRVGTRSKVSLPLLAGGRIVGALSFGSVRRERPWPDELVERLRLLGQAFASALERKRMELSLAERLGFEKLLSNLTARFSDLSAIDFERELEEGVRGVVEFLGAERGVLIELARNGKASRSAGSEGWIDPGAFPWTMSRLQRGELVLVEERGSFPDEAATDRASWLACEVKPQVAVPLLVGGAVIGGLVLASPDAERAASEELPLQLRLLGGVLANALSRRQAELEAERLRQDLAHIGRISAVGELTASLAHELNQPLGAILSNAQAAQRLLGAERIDLDEIREILRDIVTDDKRAGEVIRRLRALLTKGELERKPLYVNDVVRDVARLVRSAASARKVSLSVELAADLPQVLGDRVQLQQVVLNLVLNGLEAMRERASERGLLVRTARGGATKVEVAVQDSGAGIEEDDPETLFQPLYTTKPGGLGMGLAIARTIVEAHGGRLVGASNPWGGATFRFSLPMAGEERR
jgi:signal transduction histidine kinase/integral membrane sensor domain MASE1